MSKVIRPRHLWYETKSGRRRVPQDDLRLRAESMVILGEAGMGKTELSRQLANEVGHSRTTARQLIRRGVAAVLGSATTLVIDALDEVTAKGEGDAVDQVLAELAKARFPRFILTCRVADWRNASALVAIREDYPNFEPLVLHIEPLERADVIAILGGELEGAHPQPDERARQIVANFQVNNLDGLLANPQTLELVAAADVSGHVPPANKSELFRSAVSILRTETRDDKAVLLPDEATALDAAGAAFAALILTGAVSVVREVAQPNEDEIPLAEIKALPGGANIEAVLGSRLFGGKAERFTYWHRSIGEYLGARWLASRATSKLARRRILSLLQSDIVVPASLRGLHAWLAHQDDGEIALQVIAKDPVGILEYADPSALKLDEARALLVALREVAERDPYLLGWRQYHAKGLMRAELLHDIRSIVMDPEVEFRLRALLLEAMPGTSLAKPLRDDLLAMLLDRSAPYPYRARASAPLVSLEGVGWEDLVRTLLDEGTEDGVRLALDLVVDLPGMPVSDALLVDLVLAQAQRETRTIMLFRGLADALPESRLETFLDAFAASLPRLGNRHDRPNNSELTDLGYQIIGRRLRMGEIEPLKLWAWLRPFDEELGYARDSRKGVHDVLRANDDLRRTIQRHVLLDEPSDRSIWDRAWSMSSRSPGLTPTEGDLLILFDLLDPGDRATDKWRDLVRLCRHSENEGAAVRERAKAFVENRVDMLEWIDGLTQPRVHKWEIKQREESRRRAAKRAMEWQEHRKAFDKHRSEMEAGEFQWLINPARAYMGQFNDIGEKSDPHCRVAEWLGEDLAAAAHVGFERFLQSSQPPSAEQVAESLSQSRMFHALSIILAALAERLRTRPNDAFDGVSDDRLLAAYYDTRISRYPAHQELGDLIKAIEAEVERRGIYETAIRGWVEPQFKRSSDHVSELYQFVRNPTHAALALRLAQEWLERFPKIGAGPEAELINVVLRGSRDDPLRTLEKKRRRQRLDQARRNNWNAVAFIVDFDAQRRRLEADVGADWLWAVRDRLGERRAASNVRLSNRQIAWLFSLFRAMFPSTPHPQGGWSGDSNPWDATEFLEGLAAQLADRIEPEARDTLKKLATAPADGYTFGLRALVAEQERKLVAARFAPPTLAELKATVEDKPPQTVADLQATVLALLDHLQDRVRSAPDDAWRGFYAGPGTPRNEEWCRDHILTILTMHPDGVGLSPEGHLADDKRADILASVGRLRLPIEVKGQWHPKLWTAADEQLDRFYAADYASDRRGVYLVLWFGENVSASKRLKRPPLGTGKPATPEILRQSLIETSDAARDGRLAVFVLDLSREP